MSKGADPGNKIKKIVNNIIVYCTEKIRLARKSTADFIIIHQLSFEFRHIVETYFAGT